MLECWRDNLHLVLLVSLDLVGDFSWHFLMFVQFEFFFSFLENAVLLFKAWRNVSFCYSF